MTEQTLPLWRRVLMGLLGIRRPPQTRTPSDPADKK